ncbi:hypothetical protein NSED_05635 [Candidatus Nitrosopumilus sediminis]|uniref:Uncharacterized protein n=1 Tax=Candidatus Nitrosopumilus sediminis TaxID=1229909 RepID=K0BBW0_9ARCH|nr:hypothetical protein NSED_05635 [Candidatus Nitrosopumilus sediminis]
MEPVTIIEKGDDCGIVLDKIILSINRTSLQCQYRKDFFNIDKHISIKFSLTIKLFKLVIIYFTSSKTPPKKFNYKKV